MDEFRKRLIYLHHYPGMTWKKLLDILKKDPSLQSPETHLQSLLPITKNQHQLIVEQIHQYSYNQIYPITYFDDEYPHLLKEIYQPPWVLYCKGDIKLLKRRKKLAIVGSRKITEYGKTAVEMMMPAFVNDNIVIVSGLALGIDTIAHRSAINNGGHTIAVIAGGIYHIYPQKNKPLALEMMETQLIISEYPPNSQPVRWHFPARNRIISGLCQGTFIVEAKKKSGSLITANYAIQEGREVFALPGSIFSSYSMGTNELIQQGAKPVLVAKDIIEEIRPY